MTARKRGQTFSLIREKLVDAAVADEFRKIDNDSELQAEVMRYGARIWPKGWGMLACEENPGKYLRNNLSGASNAFMLAQIDEPYSPVAAHIPWTFQHIPWPSWQLNLAFSGKVDETMPKIHKHARRLMKFKKLVGELFNGRTALPDDRRLFEQLPIIAQYENRRWTDWYDITQGMPDPNPALSLELTKEQEIASATLNIEFANIFIKG
jgi:hypothetical protein